MRAFIITIGDELLIGQVTDTNSGWIARKLLPYGVNVIGKMTVADEKQDILFALNYAENKADLVIITGGLGPTNDDVTVSVLVDFFETALLFHEGAFAKLKARLDQFQVAISPSHRQQCHLPESAELLNNSKGTAPGMWFEKKETFFVAIPGVPSEMKAIMLEEIIPKLQGKSNVKNLYKTFLIAGLPESQLSEKLEKVEAELPTFISLAYMPRLGTIRIRIGGIHKDEMLLAQATESATNKIKNILGNDLVATEDIDFAQAIGELLLSKKKTLATAESCTGGNIAHLLTKNSGSSAYYKGSIVAYANHVKITQLGVRSDTLDNYGAVSEQTVKEMAIGIRKAIGTDFGIATTGIAGPTGGTLKKPVGTIWLAVSSKEKTVTKKLQLGNDRLTNIEFSTILALNMLRKVFLMEKES